MTDRPDNGSSQKTWTDVIRELSHKWATFLGIVLSPSVLVLLLATVGLIALSLATPELENQPIIAAIITIIISLFSGLVGVLVSKRWSEITEGGVLVTRGKSAIRGLKLLVLNLSKVERRTKTFLSRLEESDDEYAITRSSYEEIMERCDSLQEEAINSIEEWQDIIPEANVTTQIGTLSDLKSQQLTLELQISDAQSELDETKAQSEEEKKSLNKQLGDKEKELNEVKKKLRSKELEIDSSVLSGLSSTNLRPYLGLTTSEPRIPIGVHTCTNCGHVFTSSGGRTARCPQCQELVKEH